MHNAVLDRNRLDDWRESLFGSKTRFSLLAYFCSIILGGFIFLCSILAYSTISKHDVKIKDFKRNWSLKPIVDIQTSIDVCPPGYEPIIEGDWPGTNSGWDWSNSWWPFQKKLYSSSCSEDDNSCDSVDERNSQPLQSFNGYKICGLRIGDNFIQSKRPSVGYTYNMDTVQTDESLNKHSKL